MEINLNETVKVKLTKEGGERLRDFEDEQATELGLVPYHRKAKADGYYYFQLYDLITVFGKEGFTVGDMSPFVGGSIIYEPYAGKVPRIVDTLSRAINLEGEL